MLVRKAEEEKQAWRVSCAAADQGLAVGSELTGKVNQESCWTSMISDLQIYTDEAESRDITTSSP